MNSDHAATFREAFNIWFGGDAAAVALCLDLLAVAHTWDDLVDGDKPVSPAEINAVFKRLLIDIPRNPFYRACQDELMPLLQNVFLQWQAANVFEAERSNLPKAYMLRAGIYQIFAYVAWLIGGDDHAALVSPQVWRLYGENLADFEREMNHA
jgi:hypothetical protein